MNVNDINRIRKKVRDSRPLIHCITNPISINQCANAVLAVGASPIMAEHPQEAAEITQTAKAVMLNIGNITDIRMQSIMISAKTAAEKGIPFVIDTVGACCSDMRRKYVENLLSQCTPSVIKGNYSEIMAVNSCSYSLAGVDADGTIDINSITAAAVSLAEKHSTVVLASGKTDIVTDGKKVIYVHNGTEQLAQVTGTGCMQGALCAAYLSAAVDAVAAAVTACAVFGICGQLAHTAKGSGSFMVNLMDALSALTEDEVENLLKIEVTKIEKT